MLSKQTTKQQSGMSIIEVVITLFIIGVTLILFQSTSNTVILNRYGRYKEIALRAADKKVQTMRTTAFASLPVSGTYTDPLLSTLPQAQATMTVSTENVRLKRVVVNISWKAPQGNSRQSVQIDTLIAQGGLGQ